MEWEKVACWRTKVAIALKRVKLEEKLLWKAYRNSPTLFRTVSVKILEKREREIMHIQGLPKVLKYPLLSQERVKLRISNFVRTFISSIGTKAH